MRSPSRIAVFALTMLSMGILAGCNMPGSGSGGPTPILFESTSSPVSETTSSPTMMATEIVPSPTATTAQPQPNVTPIPHLIPGTAIDLTWIAMISGTQGWAIGGTSGHSDHIFNTLDSGENWRDVTPPQAAEVGIPQAATAFFLDAHTGWVVFHPQDGLDGSGSMALIVWLTMDGGASWSGSAPLAVDLSGATTALPELDFIDAQHGWILLQLGAAGMNRYPIYFLRTSDGGASWQTLIDPYQGLYLQSCPKTGWIFEGDTGLVSIGSCPIDSAAIDWSSDAGLTWNEVRLPFPSSYSGLAGNAGCQAHSPILIPATPWIAAMDCRTFDDPPQDLHFLYQTTDGGANWSIKDYPGGSLYFLNAQNAWAFGKEIYRTTDGGSSWTKISTVIWDGQFNVVDSQTIFAVARSGTELALVKSQNGGSSWAIVEPVIGP